MSLSWLLERLLYVAFGVLIGICLLLALSLPASAQQLTKVGRHITSATTTTLVAGSAGSSPIAIFHGSLCVDAGGVQTGVILQDSAGTNLVGTSVKYVIPAGGCLWMPFKGNSSPYFVGTGVGRGLQVVTDAAGPLEVYVEVAK